MESNISIELHKRWSGMIKKCYDENYKRFNNYGAKGIKVCDRWHNFDNFLEDCKKLFSDGKFMKRINRKKDYEPSNVIWTDEKINIGEKNKKSKFLGIKFNKYNNIWTATICLFGKKHFLGNFENERDAAIFRNDYILKHHLRNKLNII